MMGDYICCDYTDSKLLITVGWLILYAKHRTLRKLTGCFVQHNLSDQAEQGGTRGKIRGRKKKESKCRIEEKVTTGVGCREGMKTAEGKWLSP